MTVHITYICHVCWRLTVNLCFPYLFGNMAYLLLYFVFLFEACRPEKYLRFQFPIGATLNRLASSSSPSLWPTHAFTWREARNPKDTDRWDPKLFPQATAAATANKCCRKYAIVSGTFLSHLTRQNWTSAALGKCIQRTSGRKGAATTRSILTTRPCRRSVNLWCPLPMNRAHQAPRRTSTCRQNRHLWASRR